MPRLGSNVLIKIGGSLVAGQLDSSMSADADLMTIINNGGRFTEQLSGRVGLSVSVTVLYDDSVFYTLWSAMTAGQSISVTYGGTSTGDKYLSFSGYIKNISTNDGKNAVSTISLQIQSSGQVQLLTV